LSSFSISESGKTVIVPSGLTNRCRRRRQIAESGTFQRMSSKLQW